MADLNPNFNFDAISLNAADILEEAEKHCAEIEPEPGQNYSLKPHTEDPKSKSINPADLLQQSVINPEEEVEADKPCLEIIGHSEERFTIGTLGNFSMLIGKAKSRKSFLVSIFLAAVLKNFLESFQMLGTLPKDQSVCLYFDTEQSKFHVHRAAKRVLRLCGVYTHSDFRTYGLRKFSHQERLSIIEHAIYNTPGLGFVVIDGIRDLIADPNEASEACMIAGKLLKWTEEKNIHIVVVLHQNKGDSNARGHIGTELQNKAESVLSITKDSQNKAISIVEPEYCRDKDFESFAFEIDDQGLPILVDGWSAKKQRGEKPKSITPGNFENHSSVIAKVFKTETKLSFNSLLTQIRLAMDDLDKTIGETKARDFIHHYLNEGFIIKTGTPNTKNCFYELPNTA